jgi:UPF0042 nucleotide-binding protein
VSALHVVVVTGLSGAGRSTALHVLEDLGFFCVDNLPPPVLPQMLATLAPESAIAKVALGIDVRTGAFLEAADPILQGLSAGGLDVEILFLDATDSALVQRYSETRRPHPLAPGGDLLAAIQNERERLATLRARARHVIDTTRLNVHELRRLLVDLVARTGGRPRMVTRFVSFGFKYGLPVDADLVFDLRYLPNPHFVPELRPKTGQDADVAAFVLGAPETQELLGDLERMLSRLLPRYEREGKTYLTVAIGCTGGRHRSVAVAAELGRLFERAREVVVVHRDAAR